MIILPWPLQYPNSTFDLSPHLRNHCVHHSVGGEIESQMVIFRMQFCILMGVLCWFFYILSGTFSQDTTFCCDFELDSSLELVQALLILYLLCDSYRLLWCSLSGDPYKYNVLPPLPAQRNLTPPPTLYPQQPVSTPDNYHLPRFALTGSHEISSTRSKRTDINV